MRIKTERRKITGWGENMLKKRQFETL
jgi:hypothetical protein